MSKDELRKVLRPYVFARYSSLEEAGEMLEEVLHKVLKPRREK